MGLECELLQVGLNIAGEKFEGAASGNGPVDAAIKALKRLLIVK